MNVMFSRSLQSALLLRQAIAIFSFPRPAPSIKRIRVGRKTTATETDIPQRGSFWQIAERAPCPLGSAARQRGGVAYPTIDHVSADKTSKRVTAFTDAHITLHAAAPGVQMYDLYSKRG
jgi:hypothetical protein